MSLYDRIVRLLMVLPAILLSLFMNVFITSVVSFTVMAMLAPKMGGIWPLVIAILTAIVVYMWLVFSYKVRSYIQKLGALNDR